MIGDLPTPGSSSYASNTLALANIGAGNIFGQHAAMGDQDFVKKVLAEAAEQKRNVNFKPQQEIIAMAARRLVKVVIVDPNENVPLEDAVLYNGEEKMTDATDQELFFEIDIKKVLDDHNAKRAKMIDKKVKERTEYLEPAKIRDLKMVVVNIAAF
jgi:hypothetical protein